MRPDGVDVACGRELAEAVAEVADAGDDEFLRRFIVSAGGLRSDWLCREDRRRMGRSI